MEYEEAVESLIKKFTSGNSCSVPQATITREEWEAIHSQLELLSGEMPLSVEDTKLLIDAIKNPGPQTTHCQNCSKILPTKLI